MSDAELDCLLGCAVDRERGDGYQPAPVPPVRQPVYQVSWVALLPGPEGMDRGCLTTIPPWWQRAVRQVVPRHRTRDCCHYHSIDWHRVSASAIRIVRQAHVEGLTGEAFAGRVSELIRAGDLPGLERQAARELLSDEAGIQLSRDDDGPYINGRHRVTVMLEAGVRKTATIRWEMPASARGSY
jgi:hypothetical protein